MANQTSNTTDLQRDQERLLAEALERPGVADAIAAYARASEHSQPVPTVVAAKVGYATGGNS